MSDHDLWGNAGYEHPLFISIFLEISTHSATCKGFCGGLILTWSYKHQGEAETTQFETVL